MKNMMKVYAARAYTKKRPRTTKYVDINIPEYLPTIPKDNNETHTTLSSGYFVNSNYPITQGTVTTTHYLSLPLLGGTSCPTIFPKGTEFLLFIPTMKIEEGYLMYIG